MRRVVILCVLAGLATGCVRTVRPDQGQEAVIVRKPIFFGHGGVDSTPVKPGSGPWLAWTSTPYYVATVPLRVDMEFDDLMTSSGVPIDFHAVITYQVTDTVKLVRDFGADYNGTIPGFFTRNLDQPFRTAVRDSVKKRTMQEMAITVTAAEAVDAEVTLHMLALIKETGVPIRLIDLSLGRANPPDAVKNQRIATAEQEQRLITEQQRKLAEDQRKMAEQSRAEADAAYNYKMQLTPAQYLQLEAIKMQRDVCAKGGCTFLFGEVTPLLNVR